MGVRRQVVAIGPGMGDGPRKEGGKAKIRVFQRCILGLLTAPCWSLLELHPLPQPISPGCQSEICPSGLSQPLSWKGRAWPPPQPGCSGRVVALSERADVPDISNLGSLHTLTAHSGEMGSFSHRWGKGPSPGFKSLPCHQPHDLDTEALTNYLTMP